MIKLNWEFSIKTNIEPNLSYSCDKVIQLGNKAIIMIPLTWHSDPQDWSLVEAEGEIL